MAFNYSPKIVRDGLILYLDAANPKSYRSGSNTIFDLSGNNNHGTLYNGVGFSTVNSGVLTFAGGTDHVGTSGPNLSSTNYTVIGAARYSGATRGRIISAYLSATLSNWLLGHWSNSVENYYAEGWVTSANAGGSDTNWRIYAGTGNISGDSYSFYVNGALNSGPNNGGSAGPNRFAIGSYGDSGEASTSEFSFLLAYNRVLTPSEILQNYNAHKSRFNLR